MKVAKVVAIKIPKSIKLTAVAPEKLLLRLPISSSGKPSLDISASKIVARCLSVGAPRDWDPALL